MDTIRCFFESNNFSWKMVSDSSFSYVHMENQVSVLFIESWENLKLQWDDVEFPYGNEVLDQNDNLLQQFFSQNEDPENDPTLADSNNPLFNSSYANRKKRKNQHLNWKDIDLDAFHNYKHSDKIRDQTILNKPKLDQFYDPDLVSFMGISRKGTHLDPGNRTFNDIGNIHHSSINEETNFDGDNIINDLNINNASIDIDSVGSVPNPNVSASFLHQFTTPIVNNRTYLQNFQGSTHRTSSQQRKHPNDNNPTIHRNISYNTPRHDNIR